MTQRSGFIGSAPIRRSASSVAASNQAAAAYRERQEAQREASEAAEAARRAAAARQARERAAAAPSPQPAAPARHEATQPRVPLQPGDTKVTVQRGRNGKTYRFGNTI